MRNEQVDFHLKIWSVLTDDPISSTIFSVGQSTTQCTRYLTAPAQSCNTSWSKTTHCNGVVDWSPPTASFSATFATFLFTKAATLTFATFLFTKAATLTFATFAFAAQIPIKGLVTLDQRYFLPICCRPLCGIEFKVFVCLPTILTKMFNLNHFWTALVNRLWTFCKYEMGAPQGCMYPPTKMDNCSSFY